MNNKEKLAKLQASLNNPNIADAQKVSIKAAIEKLKELIAKEEKPEKKTFSFKDLKYGNEFKFLKSNVTLVENETMQRVVPGNTIKFKKISGDEDYAIFEDENGTIFSVGVKEFEKLIENNLIAKKETKPETKPKNEKEFNNFSDYMLDVAKLIEKEFSVERSEAIIAAEKIEKRIKSEGFDENQTPNWIFNYLKKEIIVKKPEIKEHTLTDLKNKISEIRANLRAKSGKGNDNVDFVVETLDFSLVTLPFLMQTKVYGSIILAAYAELKNIETTSIDFSDESFENFLSEYFPDKKDGFATADSKAMLNLFVGKSQYGATVNNKELIPTMIKLFNQILLTPTVYASKADDKFTLHYFNANSDIYIKELDYGTGLQDYGFVILNGDLQMAEQGYTSIQDLIKQGFELDYYYTPKTLAEIKKETKIKEVDEVEDEEEDGVQFYFEDHTFESQDGSRRKVLATKEAEMLLKRISKENGKNVKTGVNYLTFDMPIKGTKEFAKIGFLDNGGEFKIDVTLPNKDEARSALVVYFTDYDEATEKRTVFTGEKIIDEAFQGIEDYIKQQITIEPKIIKSKENKYKLGDKYSANFDDAGMLNYAATKIDVNTSIKDLDLLHQSFEDNNYHTESKPLWDAIQILNHNENNRKDEKFGAKLYEFINLCREEIQLEPIVVNYKVDVKMDFVKEPENKKPSEDKINEVVNYYIAQILNEFGVTETEISDIDEEIDGDTLVINFKVYKNNKVEKITVKQVLENKEFEKNYYLADELFLENRFVFNIPAKEVNKFLIKNLDELDSRSQNEIYPFAQFLKEHAETLVGEKVATKSINKIAPEKKEKLKKEYAKKTAEKALIKSVNKEENKNKAPKTLKLTKRLKMQGVTQAHIDKIIETGEGVTIKNVSQKASGTAHDKAIKGALKPGKRLSRNGHIYYEYRDDMSDVTKNGL